MFDFTSMFNNFKQNELILTLSEFFKSHLVSRPLLGSSFEIKDFKFNFDDLIKKDKSIKNKKNNIKAIPSETTSLFIQLSYLCLGQNDPTKSYELLLNAYKNVEDINLIKTFYLTIFYFINRSLNDEISIMENSKSEILNYFDMEQKSIRIQLKNSQKLINFINNDLQNINDKISLGSKKNDSKTENSVDANNPYNDIITEFISNNNLSLEEVENFSNQIIKIYEKKHFLDFGHINNEKLYWSEELRQLALVVFDLFTDNIIKGKNLNAKLNTLRNYNVLSLSNQNWASLRTNIREISNSSYANENIKYIIDFQPISKHREAYNIILELIKNKF